MRLSEPRIKPLQQSEWDTVQQKVLQPFAERKQLFNIYTTIAHNPDALQAFLVWGSYVLRRTSLPARERELIILRTGFLCKSGYEWAQHSRLGKQAGLTDAELCQIKIGANAEQWSEADNALLNATEELHRDYFISDASWNVLQTMFTPIQCMDIVFIVGHYTQVCMMLNSFGVQLDEGLEKDDDLT